MSAAADSVKARLKDRSRADGRPFQELLELYALERFLHRLSVSPHAEKLVLKGALMLRAWDAPASRPTRDAEFLGRLPNDRPRIEALIAELCEDHGFEDGLDFDAGSIRSETITEDAEYVGVRVKLRAFLGRTRVPVQLDIGFGDAVTPAAELGSFPTLLDHPPPQLLMYRRETAVAEKAQILVKLGLYNSRLKDDYDLWLLSTAFDFEGPELVQALQATFDRRSTQVPGTITGLAPEFASDPAKATQWTAFLKRHRIADAPETLSVVVAQVARFLLPPLGAVGSGTELEATWTAAAGQWR